MAFYRALVRREHDSGLPQDDFVNVWHFDSDAGAAAPADLDNIRDRLTAFYQAFQVHWSQVLSGNNDITYYDMSEPTPRVPLRTDTFVVTPQTTVSLPSEIAVVMSYNAAPAAGLSPARLRGRLYLGPWDNGVVSMDTGVPRLHATLHTLLMTTIAAQLAPPGTGLPNWAVFSPTILASGGTLDAAFSDVVGGYVDDAFDIQRRRGEDALTRQTFAF